MEATLARRQWGGAFDVLSHAGIRAEPLAGMRASSICSPNRFGLAAGIGLRRRRSTRTGRFAVVLPAPRGQQRTRAQVSVSKDEVLEAKTVRIIPTSFSATEAEAKLSQAQKKLIATVVDRSLCIGLSDRFQVVAAAQPADLIVHAFITRIVPTDEAAAAVSRVTSVATSVATSAASVSPGAALVAHSHRSGRACAGGGSSRFGRQPESRHGLGAGSGFPDHQAAGLQRRRCLRPCLVVWQ